MVIDAIIRIFLHLDSSAEPHTIRALVKKG